MKTFSRLLLGCSMLALIGQAGAQTAAPIDAGLLQSFRNPAQPARPIARHWFPDAGSGGSAEGLALVRNEVTGLAAAGFGGMEVAFLSDNTDYTNDEARTIGFGTQNWRNIVTKLLQTANAVPGGFGVSFTLSPHWPVTLDTIDPNDPGQQHELVNQWRKITAADIAAGSAALPLPPQRTRDIAGGFGGRGNRQTYFLFTRDLVAASVARVVRIDNGKPVFALASLTDITGATHRQTAAPGAPYHEENGVKYAGSPAGVPDAAEAQKLGADYNVLLSQWGPAPSDPNLTAKIDAEGNRRRMADWQYEYTADLSSVPQLKQAMPSPGDGLEVGDYVLVGVYAQGTGQVQSGGASITQYARTYVVNVYGTSGVNAIKDYWDQKILTPEIRALMRENSEKAKDVSIFEDSFEVSHDHPFWTDGMFANIQAYDGYDARRYAAVVALDTPADWDNAAEATNLADDYTLALGRMFRDQHVAGLNAFGASLGYKYRVQVETGLPGLAAAEPSAGIQEGDNGALLDTWRELAAATALSGTRLLSEEALTTDGKDYNQNYVPLLNVLNDHLAMGVNRFVYHGSPFPRTFDLYHSGWPGWEFMLFNPPGFGAYQARQVWWQDFNQFNDYITRMSMLNQAGTAREDVAVLLGARGRYAMPSSESMPALLDAGYSYHVLDEKMLDLPGVVANSGVLDAQGPGYRAVIVRGAATGSVGMLKHLVAYAQAGVPVILLDSSLTKLMGSEHGDETAANLAQQLAALKGLKNVSVANNEDDALAQLRAAGITPAVSYQTPGLQVTERDIGGNRLVQLHSFGPALDADAHAGDSAIRLDSTAGLKSGDRLQIGNGAGAEVVTIASVKAAPATSFPLDDVPQRMGPPMGQGRGPRDTTPNVMLTGVLKYDHAGPKMAGGFGGNTPGAQISGVVQSQVTVTGSSAPYLLDAWNGTTRPIGLYTATPTGVRFTVDLAPHDSEWVVMGQGAAPLHATSASGGEVLTTARGALVHRAMQPGQYSVTLSSGAQRSVSVTSVPTAPDLSDGWTLALQSWGPDPKENQRDPSVSSKTNVNFRNITLASWSKLPADQAMLGKLGVTDMSGVIGIGHYTRRVSLPADWTRTTGAYLTLAHGNDIIAGVTVNGTRLGPVDPLTDRIDLGRALHAGDNVIEVKIDSPMANRVPGFTTKQDYGLTGLTLVPYVQTDLGSGS